MCAASSGFSVFYPVDAPPLCKESENALRSRLNKIFVPLFGCYALFLCLLPILRLTLGERFWPLVLLSYMPGVALIVPIPFLLLGITEKRVRFAGVLVLFFAVVNFMGMELPGRGCPNGPISVMTYNIRAGLGGAEEIARFMKEQELEILALQEARPPISNPESDPIEVLTAELERYQLARGGIRDELVLYSRYPILDSKEVSLGDLSRALVVRLDVDGRVLRVVNVHLMTGDPKGIVKSAGYGGIFRRLEVTAQSRKVQFEALSELMKSSSVPTLLVGDFNTPPHAEGPRLLSSRMADSFERVGTGFGYTYRADIPVWRIDYIWCSDKLMPCIAKVGDSRLSDHLPLTARFDWVVE